MPTTSVSLSTAIVPGPSAPVVLDYRQGKPVAWLVTTNSSQATSDFTWAVAGSTKRAPCRILVRPAVRCVRRR
jgi:hypothetical protein